MIFQVLTAQGIKMVVFLVVEPCELVEVYPRSGGTCCLHCKGYRPNASTSEKLGNIYQTTLRNSPE